MKKILFTILFVFLINSVAEAQSDENPIVSIGKTKIHQELNPLIIEGLETETIIYPLLYTLTDIKGNIVQHGAAEYDGALIRIDVSGLAAGVYFISFADNVHKFSVAR